MIDLFERSDPARGLEPGMARLRSMVNERVGRSAPLRPTHEQTRRPWLIAAASFVAVAAIIAGPVVLRQPTTSVFAPRFDGIADLPGVEAVVPLASGGVTTTAVDGDTIWAMVALQNNLQRISATSARIEDTYPIDAYVEGVVVGGGYVWLMSYDNAGEVLRFDPASGVVDATIPIGGAPGHSVWFNDSLWVGNDLGELHRISPEGEIVSTVPGELKGEGLGYLWVNDPATGVISSLAGDGTRGGFVISTAPGGGIPYGNGVRSIGAAGGYLWLMDGEYPYGTNLSRFDPGTGDLVPVRVTYGLHSMVAFDGALWVTSHTDHLLIKVDLETGDLSRYPLPGKPGGVFGADGSLWVTLFHPGAVVRLDPAAGLIEAGEIAVDRLDGDDHRFLCTGTDSAQGPTILLEPYDWIDYGLWSVIQAELSQGGYVVCAHGYLQGEATPAQRAADMDEALVAEGITGPYVLVATGEGVHATRLFADGRDDVAGVVLVDPMAVGFPAFLDTVLGLEEDEGHPPWLDLDPAVSDALGGFGDEPLVVLRQDPQAVFLSQRFIDAFGDEAAAEVNAYWEEGLDFYARLSTDSRSVVAFGTGQGMVVWDRPDLVVQEVLDMLARLETS